MKFLQIGNTFVNLAHVTRINFRQKEEKYEAEIYMADSTQTPFGIISGNEAHALKAKLGKLGLDQPNA